MLEKDGELRLVGITSFGHIFGCELTYPGGFTRVQSHLTFINEVLGLKL